MNDGKSDMLDPKLREWWEGRIRPVAERMARTYELRRLAKKAKPWGITLSAPELDGRSLRLTCAMDAGPSLQLQDNASIATIEAIIDEAIAQTKRILEA